MNLVAPLVWNKVHRRKLSVRGEAGMLRFQKVLAAVSWRREEIAMTIGGTWGQVSKKSSGRRGKICKEVGYSGLLQMLAPNQVFSWKRKKSGLCSLLISFSLNITGSKN